MTVSGLSCRTRDLHRVMQDLSLQHSDSLVVARGPSCSLAHGILVPRPGIEPMSPTLQVDGFFTTGPLRNSLKGFSKGLFLGLITVQCNLFKGKLEEGGPPPCSPLGSWHGGSAIFYEPGGTPDSPASGWQRRHNRGPSLAVLAIAFTHILWG